MPLDIKQLAEAVSTTIKGWVSERLKALEAGLPDLVRKHVESLPKPKDGKDADPELIKAAVALEVRSAVAALPSPKDGKDFDPNAMAAEIARQVALLPKAVDGKDGRDGAAGPAGKDGAPGSRGETGERGETGPQGKDGAPGVAGKDGAPGINGKDGAPGKDYEETVLKAAVALEVRAAVDALPPPVAGKDADPEVMKAAIAQAVREAVSAIPVPQNGKDADQTAIVSQVFDLVMRAMPKPQDGKSVTVDDVKPLLEAEVQHWELEFERRATDVLSRLAERYKGKDGADGFTVDDLELSVGDDGRTVVVSLKSGTRTVRKEIRLGGMPIYRGPFKSGQASKENDMWTWGGSMWKAKRNTSTPPPGDDWQLVVKGTK